MENNSTFDSILPKFRLLSHHESTSMKLLQNFILSQFINRPTRDASIQNKQQTDTHPLFVPKKKRGSKGTTARISNKPCVNVISKERQQQKLKTKFKAEEEKEITKPIKKVKVVIVDVPEPVPVPVPVPVPFELREKIERKGGTEIKLVIRKNLFKSDLIKSQNRLNMPVKQVNNSFLNEEEKKEIIENDNEVPVKLLEPCGYVSSMRLKIWNMNSSKNYVLLSWNAVCERKENEELGIFMLNTMIEVWSFRVDGKLWLTINKAAGEDGGTSGREV